MVNNHLIFDDHPGIAINAREFLLSVSLLWDSLSGYGSSKGAKAQRRNGTKAERYNGIMVQKQELRSAVEPLSVEINDAPVQLAVIINIIPAICPDKIEIDPGCSFDR